MDMNQLWNVQYYLLKAGQHHFVFADDIMLGGSRTIPLYLLGLVVLSLG